MSQFFSFFPIFCPYHFFPDISHSFKRRSLISNWKVMMNMNGDSSKIMWANKIVLEKKWKIASHVQHHSLPTCSSFYLLYIFSSLVFSSISFLFLPVIRFKSLSDQSVSHLVIASHHTIPQHTEAVAHYLIFTSQQVFYRYRYKVLSSNLNLHCCGKLKCMIWLDASEIQSWGDV